MIDTKTLLEYLVPYRTRLEQAWTEETASPKLRPITGKPISTGQCSATSLLLFDELHATFGQHLLLKVVVGKVLDLQRQTEAIELHVWLHLYEDVYDVPWVIDLTADQASLIDQKVILEKNLALVESEKLLYLPYSMFGNPGEMKEGTQKRAALLRERMATIA